jgi:hypothetical protein
MKSLSVIIALVIPGVVSTPPASMALPLPPDIVAGNLIQFNDNGNWTWYSDERSVVDTARGNLVVGSDACGIGVGGSPRAGDVEAVIYNLGSRRILRG